MLDTCTKFLQKKMTDSIALEIGPGNNPAICKTRVKSILYVDNEFESNCSERVNKNFLKFKTCQRFDLIYERLCWHEQNKKNWHRFLENVIEHLAPGGIFISEHAINHKDMNFDKKLLFYNQKTMELHDLFTNKAIRFIPSALFVENTLIEKKLNIKYFKIPFGTKVILERRNTQTKYTDPDLLQFIAQKQL